VGLGKDFSGNANYWVTNNISITAGTTYDSMTDVPTLTSATASNYAVFNPLNKSTVGTATPSNGNLNVLLDRSSNDPWIQSTIAFPSSGKWYLEYSQTSIDVGSIPYNFIGVMDVTTPISTPVSSVTGVRGYYLWDGRKRSGTTATSYGSATALNDIIGVAVDMDSGKIWFAVNNTWVNSGSPTGGTNAAFTDLTGTTWSFFNSILGQTSSNSFVNFGQRPFTYTPPTGFVALNTFNLPTPTIGATASTTANKYFDAKLYTGNGGTQSITGFNFSPDFIWAKSRSNAVNHNIYDSIRGVNKLLSSSLTDAEYTGGTGLTSFNSDGYTTGSDSWLNASGQTYVAWGWDANGTGVTNTAGSITSTVSANTSAGFSIVTYTGNGTSGATVGHGLGVSPSMVILKRRDSSSNWQVKHTSLNANQNLELNSTAAVDTAPGSGYISAISSTTLTLLNGGSAITNVNGSGATYVAYCFAPIAGYSAFGSYTGNGSTDGTFVYTGFRPRFVMFKRTDAVEQWAIRDTARDTYNASELELFPNLSNAEEDNNLGIDLISNGFKIRNSANRYNASGGTYIYMAFAETPQKFALGR
jgi:hypothetical protein